VGEGNGKEGEMAAAARASRNELRNARAVTACRQSTSTKFCSVIVREVSGTPVVGTSAEARSEASGSRSATAITPQRRTATGRRQRPSGQ
jgi:hypothetical protein